MIAMHHAQKDTCWCLSEGCNAQVVVAFVEDDVVLPDEDVSQDPEAGAHSIAEVIHKTRAATILGLGDETVIVSKIKKIINYYLLHLERCL